VNKVILMSVLSLWGSSQVTAAPFVADKLDLDKYRQHVRTLSDDKFGGRAPLSQGEELTLAYLTDSLKALGLAPGFGDSYLQSVPMAKITADQSMVLRVDGMSLQNGTDFTARTQRLSDTVTLEGSEFVFAGFGINAPEYGWNDYRDLDVKGKTLVVLVNDPGFATQDPNLFKGNAMTYYGRWTYKYEEGLRQGAKAVFIVHETQAAAYGWGVVQNSNMGTKFSLIDAQDNQGQLGIMGWLHLDAAKRIFKRAGLDYESVKRQALSPDFKAVPLQLSADLILKNSIEKAESHNVLAKLPGSERPNETLVLHAHWDHLGTVMEEGKPQILNGAVDNASGVAGMLELARVFKEMADVKPFRRSILFSAFTAEETGLIGAQHFAEHPPVPTKDLVAFLNIDGMNVNQGVDYILEYGQGVSELGSYLKESAAEQGRVVKADPRPQNGLMFRSDHFALAQQGVPGLLFMSLGDTDPDYIDAKYHKGADDFDPNWSLAGVSQDLDLIGRILARLASNDDWPKWLEESDFKARRARDGL
jgi:Zn-dependent M28 family amino/carboxypeptidase